MIRVVIADDQALVRSGLRLILDTDPELEVVAEVEDGRRAAEAVRDLHPDIVLMDIRMPGTDGITATQAILADPGNLATRVVILTTYDLDEYLYTALQAGAAGFILKGISPEDLLRGLHDVADGESLLAPTATRRLISHFLQSHRPPEAAAEARRRVALLTPRELDVLGLVASGLSNTEIADELCVGHNTVKTHVSHVLDKLQARDRAQAAIIAYQTGVVGRRDSDGTDF